MWIELRRHTEIDGVMRMPGYRVDADRRAAGQLVHDDRAEYVDGPHDSRLGRGYDRSDLSLESIEGIGAQTAEKIYRAMDDLRLMRRDDILAYDLTELPEVDDGFAADIRAAVRDDADDGGDDDG